MAQSGAQQHSVVIEQPQHQPEPSLRVVKSKKQKKQPFVGASLFYAAAIVVLVLSMMLYTQTKLMEITDEINEKTTQLEALEGENVRLTSSLQATTSLSAIEEQAKNELGMSHRDAYQTVYVNLEEEDHADFSENSGRASIGQRIQAVVTGVISQIQEYFTDVRNID